MSTRLDIDDDVAVLTIDRPKQLNAVDESLLAELPGRFEEAAADARCIVVTGAGDPAFVAGADIAAMKEMDPQRARAFSEKGHEVLDTVEDLDVPVVAAVNGFALGGGLELALACDLRVASEDAAFGAPEVTLGVVPGFGGTQRLTRVLGLGPGLDLLLTGRRIDAEEAHRLGLVSRVVPEGEALETARGIAERIADNAPKAVQLAKRTARKGFDASREAADQLETEAFAACFATEDQAEGMAAFLEDREATFEGR
jgi:enoyl-CoA hydratase